jgi:hypothetical protein
VYRRRPHERKTKGRNHHASDHGFLPRFALTPRHRNARGGFGVSGWQLVASIGTAL